MTTTTTAPTPSDQRVTFDELLVRSATWRRWLTRRYQTYADADAEITAAMWEQYAAGVDDIDRMFAAARTAIRRMTRSEHRFSRWRDPQGCARTVLLVDCGDQDQYERLEARLDAAGAVAELDIPARARQWAASVSSGVSAPPPAMLAGRRWAKQVRNSGLRVDYAA
jgi:hypothetical protein